MSIFRDAILPNQEREILDHLERSKARELRFLLKFLLNATARGIMDRTYINEDKGHPCLVPFGIENREKSWLLTLIWSEGI